MSDPYGARLEEVIIVNDNDVWLILEKQLDEGDPWIVDRLHPPYAGAGLYWPERTFGDGYSYYHGIVVEVENGTTQGDYIVKSGIWTREKS